MEPKELLKEAQAMQDVMSTNRRHLHAHAETGFALTDTLSFVESALREMGYEPVRCGRAGLVALAGGKKSGRVFLLRADMDALPIAEQTGLPFACENGNMHACGHDMHTAMLLGAAKLLKEHEDEIAGCVKLMFQPAEEIFEGSLDMIEAGLLENPSVDAALMIHVMAGMSLPAGTVLVCAPGISAPAADYFTIEIKGKGCHGSMPSSGVDPISAAAHILIALQELNARELALNERAVLTIGTVHGGTAANVIPDSVTMAGSLRSFDEETRDFLKRRMEEITVGIAGAFRAEAGVLWGSGCPTLANDPELADCIPRYSAELLGSHRALSVAQLSTAEGSKKSAQTAGSEDFAYVSQRVPSIMLALSAGEPEKGYAYPQHHPMVTFDESVLAPGSALYAYTAMRWLEEHQR